MGMYIIYAVLAAIGLLLVFMIIRTLCVRPKKSDVPYAKPDLDESEENEITELLCSAVRIPTVTKQKDGDDQTPFLRYHEFLRTSFPDIFARAEVETVNGYSLIIKIKGTDESLLPGCLLAHQDVVPASGDGWEVDPFGGTVKDGYVYGRGSQDMKSQMVTALYALELMLREGKQPIRTIYYCFGHDEELTGTEGAKRIVEHLKEQGVRFAFVVDEGGAVIDGKMLGIGGRVALIGTCEKGYADFILTAVMDGGHASNPKKHSASDAIADAIHDLKRAPMKKYISKPVKEMFRALAPHMKPLFKFIFVNADILAPVIKLIFGFIPITNSLISTTFAFTQFTGSDAPNVIPVKATAIINTRINLNKTKEEVQDYMQRVVGKRVKVDVLGTAFNPTPVSKTEGSEIYEKLVKSIEEAFENYHAAPYPFIAASDAKHYYAISDNVYRFTPFEYTMDDQKRIHSLNERCKIEDLPKAVNFFKRLLENTCF